MADYTGDKSLEPTPYRRAQARREGHVVKSQDLGSVVLLLGGAAIVATLGGGLAGFLVDYCRAQLGGGAWLRADPEFAVGQWHATLWSLGRCLLPILGLLCLAGVAVNVFQVGFLFLPQRLAFNAARVDPLQGLRRMFSATSLIHVGFGIAKLLIAATVACVVLYGQREAIAGLVGLTPSAIAVEVGRILFGTVVKVGAALLVPAILDYAYQWWRHEQDLKMTPQELREELKNLEGNPQVVARRKQAHRELAVGRLQRK